MVELKSLTKDTRRLIAYGLMGLLFIVGFFVLQGIVTQARRDSCNSALDNRQLLATVIGNSQSGVQQPIDPTLPEGIQQLIRDAQKQQKAFLEAAQSQFDKPLAICERVGVDSRIRLKNSAGIELVPLPAPEQSTTTTTLANGATGSAGPPGPAGPQGPPGPPGSTPPPETTTTTLPSTPTTGPCILGLVC